MKRAQTLFLLLIIATLQAACANQNQRLGQQQALEIAWKTLEPNTLSHDAGSWEVDEAKRVMGGLVVNEFSMPTRENCPGPKPPDNQPIKVSSEYWYIKVLPNQQISSEQEDTAAPSSTPVVAEPNIKAATFLIDIYSGEVVARKLTCLDTP